MAQGKIIRVGYAGWTDDGQPMVGPDWIIDGRGTDFPGVWYRDEGANLVCGYTFRELRNIYLRHNKLPANDLGRRTR